MRIPYISLVAAGALALGGCAYGDLGLGYGGGYGYGNYGYGYSPYGYGSPYYGSGYGYGGYGGYGSYYGSGYYGGYGSPFGWYDNYYYPGTGTYVYDSYRRPRVWTQSQRTYWMSRQPTTSTTVTTRTTRPNWSGFDRRTTTQDERRAAREQRQRDRNSPY